MSDLANPLINATLAAIVADFIGELSDRIVSLIETRVRLVESVKVGAKNTSLMDALLGTFLHVGFLSLGTNFAVEALPWLTQDAGAYMVFALVLGFRIPQLGRHLRILSDMVFDNEAYKSEASLKEDPKQSIDTPSSSSQPL
jgi:hypothetical protein